jgi:hypothetical protein
VVESLGGVRKPCVVSLRRPFPSLQVLPRAGGACEAPRAACWLSPCARTLAQPFPPRGGWGSSSSPAWSQRTRQHSWSLGSARRGGRRLSLQRSSPAWAGDWVSGICREWCRGQRLSIGEERGRRRAAATEASGACLEGLATSKKNRSAAWTPSPSRVALAAFPVPRRDSRSLSPCFPPSGCQK